MTHQESESHTPNSPEGHSSPTAELIPPFYIDSDGIVTDGGHYARQVLRRVIGDTSPVTYPLTSEELNK